MHFFISDTHLGHENIIKYCNRPFKSLQEMDETIIANWNNKIKKGDIVFFLGDFCLTKSSEAPNSIKRASDYYRSQLNGDIIFLKGNHDKNNQCKSIIESIIINHGGKRIYLTHNPKFAKKEFEWNFTGHCHGNFGTFRKLEDKSTIIDLSVDCWNYTPVNINEINEAYSDWKRKNV
jgi:calcineurin-like phosphoesterase family protein